MHVLSWSHKWSREYRITCICGFFPSGNFLPNLMQMDVKGGLHIYTKTWFVVVEKVTYVRGLTDVNRTEIVASVVLKHKARWAKSPPKLDGILSCEGLTNKTCLHLINFSGHIFWKSLCIWMTYSELLLPGWWEWIYIGICLIFVSRRLSCRTVLRFILNKFGRWSRNGGQLKEWSIQEKLHSLGTYCD